MSASRQQHGNAATKLTQRPAQASQTATKTTTQKVVTRPGGKPVQVTETEEHIVKKTVWTRVLTGGKKAVMTTNWKHHVTHPGQAVKRIIPHASKQGKDSSGFNLSYYRKSFFLLDKQTQFDLYIAGLAPKMTKREVDKLRSSVRQISRQYKPETVMYDAHISPSGYEAPLKDIVAEASAAKLRAVAAAKKKKAAANNTANPDALPSFPTPANFTKIQVQTKPTKPQQQRPPQPQTRPTAATQSQPLTAQQRQSQQIGLAVSHPQLQPQYAYATPSTHSHLQPQRQKYSQGPQRQVVVPQVRLQQQGSVIQLRVQPQGQGQGQWQGQKQGQAQAQMVFAPSQIQVQQLPLQRQSQSQNQLAPARLPQPQQVLLQPQVQMQQRKSQGQAQGPVRARQSVIVVPVVSVPVPVQVVGGGSASGIGGRRVAGQSVVGSSWRG